MVKIQLQDLGARYGQRTIIRGVTTAAFTGGQVVAVVGPNAAGKSTLFKRMAGLIDGPGQVILQDSKKGRQGICYMPQGLNASARLTVYESVLLARKQLSPQWTVHDDELNLVEEMLEALGISDLSFRNLGELSGGQQQLVSIAQTLVREPEILLMDEPTSALDMHRQVQVLNFMGALARQQQVIVFIALHDLNQALRFADQVLVIADGTAQGSGASHEVITERMLREVYQVEARIEQCSRGQRHILIDGINLTAYPRRTTA
ncbi:MULTISPECIES: ABC transporter ATP-binding protein [Pseudomonas]|jgi:iron complex transport system ATP-binding protein|uniref:Iron complex transport system ATP-binding protein n=1 Tax=Pseudomonas poae TaxID=200451 RepID=A0A7Z1K4N1_9PSED|nr:MULTISPECIES: ABC transporter ATP-binding protein [Pseudomonas]KAA8551446.1 Fe(3+) dicitrate transport ATP-binding protein FecE [Pseudomonas marginalis]NMZ95099.1 ABC transporter ATP-binding protein [Pseudomonas marginalis]PFG72547.1 iron complex transport system ATP-binding protein [Pseudomonas poae]PUB40132.1 iron complex transport system ATP-binding protein [Pseudomonas sp. GV047]TWR67937.1 ABC transporter ATP-binding protein [Pseudomonas marginalis]